VFLPSWGGLTITAVVEDGGIGSSEYCTWPDWQHMALLGKSRGYSVATIGGRHFPFGKDTGCAMYGYAMRMTTASFNVAVVDDDENLRRSFARLLRAAGMRPMTYASAEAFLTDAVRPRMDCLVLDVQLPGMSGIKLQKKLRSQGDTTAVIFITSFDDADARAEAYAQGCAGYLRKSDSGREVLKAIKDVVGWPPRSP